LPVGSYVHNHTPTSQHLHQYTEPAAHQAFLRELLVADARPVSWSGLYLSQQMSHVTTTENMARMLATDKQMGPAGEGGIL